MPVFQQNSGEDEVHWDLPGAENPGVGSHEDALIASDARSQADPPSPVPTVASSMGSSQRPPRGGTTSPVLSTAASGSSADSGSGTVQEGPDTIQGDQNGSSSTVAPPVTRPRTRLQDGIVKPKLYTDGFIRWCNVCVSNEPGTLQEAFGDSKWKKAMEEEYNALLRNKTWHLVPPQEGKKYY